ncbi:MAG: hypothetical protein AB1898_15405 [Acidobacteriota bacterium]
MRGQNRSRNTESRIGCLKFAVARRFDFGARLLRPIPLAGPPQTGAAKMDSPRETPPKWPEPQHFSHRRTKTYRTLTGEKWLPAKAKRRLKGLGDLSGEPEARVFDELYSDFSEEDEERLYALIYLCQKGADPRKLLQRLKVLGKARLLSAKPVIEESLRELANYVRQSTGRWHDKKLAVLLRGDYPEDLLRMRRIRNRQRRHRLNSIGFELARKTKQERGRRPAGQNPA